MSDSVTAGFVVRKGLVLDLALNKLSRSLQLQPIRWIGKSKLQRADPSTLENSNAAANSICYVCRMLVTEICRVIPLHVVQVGLDDSKTVEHIGQSLE